MLKRCLVFWLSVALWSAPVLAGDQQASPADVVRVGHWLQVRGEYQGEGRFEPSDIELVAPERYDELIGTIRESEPEKKRFVLLGVRVEYGDRTSFARLDRNQLEGQRVKVEGYFQSDGTMSAREIAQRGGMRDRITGRVEEIRSADAATEFRIMNFSVPVSGDLAVDHVQNVEDYQTSESRIQSIVDRGKDEDDLFGKGVRLTDNLLFFAQIQTAAFVEDEFDLDETEEGDIVDYLGTFKGRVVYSPSDSFFSVFEVNYRRIWRDDDEDGRIDIRNERIGDAYLYWLDPMGIGLDVQIGRVDYDDEREWLYDQYLDGPKLIWLRHDWRAELSLTTTLSSGSEEEEDATNSMLYVSNNDEDRHLAAYIIHRDFDFPQSEERTYFGVRVIGEWLQDQKSWLEVARMYGSSGSNDSAGWGLDLGTTWEFHKRFSVSGGYALGTGDRASTGKDETFRQIGLQDNNGKLAGVTSFRYYGEVVDPELANLEVFTLGLGWLPKRRVSLDLVGHTYRQHQLSRRWVDSQIDKNPNGRSHDLGWEIDLIFGWRTSRAWDLEVVAGWFKPGDAYSRADEAFFGKFQFRYRL